MLLDSNLLKEALYSLVEVERTTRQEITRQSSVHNIGRIISGSIEPTPESWWKLHKAFPDSIPEPTYTNGNQVYKNTISGDVNGTANQAETMTINNELAKDDNKLTPEEMSLIRLIRTKADPIALCVELIVTVANKNDN